MRTSDEALGRAPSLPASNHQRLRPAYEVTTRHLPRATQVNAWRTLTSAAVDIEPLAAENTFIAEQRLWDLGGLVVMHSALPAVRFRRSLRHIRSDGLDHWVLSSLKRGSARIVASGTLASAVPGQLNVHSLGRPGEGDTTALEAVHLFVPRDLCREVAAVLDDPKSASVRTALGQLLADYLLRLEPRLPELANAELPALVQSIRGMILACFAPSPSRSQDAHGQLDATMLERARGFVRQRLFSPTLGTDEICRELGISRSSLYRIFEPLGGVVHYIRSQRLKDAHKALADANDRRPIVEIAAERGFLEATEFSRAFKREFGYRPTEARGRSCTPRMHVPDRRDTFATLLRRLQ